MKALCIIAVISAAAALILAARLRLIFSAGLSGRDGVYVELYIKIWFFKLRLFPAEKKAAKEIADAEPEKAGTDKKKSAPSFGSLYGAARGLSKDIRELLGFMIKHNVVVRDFSLEARIGTDDPMKTGMAVGAADAFVYGLLGIMDKSMGLKRFSVSVEPDWNSEKIKAGFYTEIYTRIIIILGIIFKALKILIKARRIFKKKGD